jgi:hypothetical protein
MNETLAGLARTAMALNVSRVGRECVCEDQEVIGTLRNQLGFIRSIGPLTIKRRMASLCSGLNFTFRPRYVSPAHPTPASRPTRIPPGGMV